MVLREATLVKYFQMHLGTLSDALYTLPNAVIKWAPRAPGDNFARVIANADVVNSKKWRGGRGLLEIVKKAGVYMPSWTV